LKKDGKIRPFAVGEIMSRVISKVALSKSLVVGYNHLLPFQVGVGVQNGIEAMLLGVNRLINHPKIGSSCKLFLVDFMNALKDCLNFY
jgi:hypothetical protein